MSRIFQAGGASTLVLVSAANADPKAAFLGPGTVVFPERYLRGSHSFVGTCQSSLRVLWGNRDIGPWQAVVPSEIPVAGFCPPPSSVCDTRLYSVTGSGHIRRPAALGLLLRFAPLWVSVPPKRNSLKAGTERPANFFRVPPKKTDLRPWEPGPLPWLSPCVTRAKSGIQNGEQQCI
jgi:hypothetical protein